MLSKVLTWIKDLPDNVKVLAGLISTTIAFILLIRANFELGIVTLFAIIFAAAFSYLARIAVAKNKPIAGFSLREADVYKYPRLRRWAVAGIFVLAFTVVLLFALKQTRYYIFAALKGTEVAPHADILIAQFNAEFASTKFEIPNRIKANLEEELQKHNIKEVKVEVLSTPIKSPEEAKVVAEQSGSKVIVWGWYDNAGVKINLYTLPLPFSGKDALTMKEVDWNMSTDISLKIREQLPSDITFISLFIIGSLYYQNNEYLKGYQMFDAAMSNLPKGIGSENESLLHFFSARSLAATGAQNTARAICEYSRAIELNPNFAAAYNNLGIIAANLYVAYNKEYIQGRLDEDVSDFKFPGSSEDCLNKIGSEGHADLFDRALELQPDSAVIRYNKLATEWLLQSNELLHGYDINAILDDIMRKDPSIPGAHVLRGVLAFDEGEEYEVQTQPSDPNTMRFARTLAKSTHLDERRFQIALQEFSTASKLLPKSAELHINVGKVYMRKGMYTEARTEFEKTLSLSPDSAEARLALADVAIRQGQSALALQYLNTINPEESERPNTAQSAAVLYSDTVAIAAVLKSRIFFEGGNTAAAIEALPKTLEHTSSSNPASASENIAYTDLINYLLGLLHALSSDVAAAKAHWKECDIPDLLDSDTRLARDASYHYNSTTDLAWYDVTTLCASEGNKVSMWGEIAQCLPRDLSQRLKKVYDIVQDRVAYRIFYRQEVLLGPALCPYVFTYDANRGGWFRDTTIIYGLNRKELEVIQARPLRYFDGRLIVREVESEISYLDQISILVTDQDGQSHVLRPQIKSLRYSDGDYLILRHGDEIYLTFDGFEQIKGAINFKIEAKGYYVPLR